jgi:sugar O-acyltransferase (sialic acid O-acetyltransferase NeuD family)
VSASTDLVIFGAGGLARETAFFIREINEAGGKWNVRGFVVEDPTLFGTRVMNLPVIEGVRALRESSYRGAAVIAVGTPELSRKVHQQIVDAGLELRFPALVHPSVVGDWGRIDLGPGVVIAPGCVLTTSIEIGRFTFVNMGVTISHDAQTGKHCRIHPRALLCGGVVLEDDVYVGAGAVVMQYRRIERGAQLGMGAVVGIDVPPLKVVAGNPARIIKAVQTDQEAVA